MTKSPLLIVLLMVAFLLSAWGNVIGAAFCPRYLAQNCFAQKAPQARQGDRESCHHEASATDMGDMQVDGASGTEAEGTPVRENPKIVVGSESSVEQTAFDRPTEPCGHCWMHSQPSSGTGTLGAVDPSPRSVEALASSSAATIALRFPNPIAIEPLEHSPPGSSFPLHVLINVFRI